MQLLGFSFPPDFRRTAKNLEELPVEYMLRIRQTFKEEYSRYVRIMDSMADRITTPYCHICEKEVMAYEELPEDWGWHDAGVGWYLMCDNCQVRYAEKFDKYPEVVRDIENHIVDSYDS